MSLDWPWSPCARIGSGVRGRLTIGLIAVLVLLGSRQPLVAQEAPPEPFETVEALVAAGAVGTLILPAGRPDRRSSAIVILQDGPEPDGRAGLYTDQLLGAGFAVLEMIQLPGDSLGAVLTALALHPRVAGQPLGLLGFGAGGRLAAQWAENVEARALLYPGCDGIAPAALAGQSVLLMHGTADPVNPDRSCQALVAALMEAGASVRLRMLPGASYAWDRRAFSVEGGSMLPRPDGAGRVRTEAWPEMAELSAAEVAGFFSASMLGQRR